MIKEIEDQMLKIAISSYNLCLIKDNYVNFEKIKEFGNFFVQNHFFFNTSLNPEVKPIEWVKIYFEIWGQFYSTGNINGKNLFSLERHSFLEHLNQKTCNQNSVQNINELKPLVETFNKFYKIFELFMQCSAKILNPPGGLGLDSYKRINICKEEFNNSLLDFIKNIKLEGGISNGGDLQGSTGVKHGFLYNPIELAYVKKNLSTISKNKNVHSEYINIFLSHFDSLEYFKDKSQSNLLAQKMGSMFDQLINIIFSETVSNINNSSNFAPQLNEKSKCEHDFILIGKSIERIKEQKNHYHHTRI